MPTLFFVGGGILLLLLMAAGDPPADKISALKRQLAGEAPAEPAPPPPESPRKKARRAVQQAVTAEKADVVPPPRSAGPELQGDGYSRDPQAIARTVSAHQAAFRLCIEQALKRDPTIKRGKFSLGATIAPGGKVIRATIDQPELDRSDLGRCLKSAARRIAFPAGEEAEVEIPLVIS